ncbi:MAG: hypothetical protein IKD14_01085 [Clostridia bacterium]|nr:hypothetical protein [Clostridia bacterium]
MIKLWAKTYKNHRIVKQTTFIVRDSKLDYSQFFDYVAQMCHELDSPTPIIIKDNIFNFAKFNFVKFVAGDFIETVDYDYLMIELVK